MKRASGKSMRTSPVAVSGKLLVSSQFARTLKGIEASAVRWAVAKHTPPSGGSFAEVHGSYSAPRCAGIYGTTLSISLPDREIRRAHLGGPAA